MPEKQGGLRLPTNAAAELQNLMKQERVPPPNEPQTQPEPPRDEAELRTADATLPVREITSNVVSQKDSNTVREKYVLPSYELTSKMLASRKNKSPLAAVKEMADSDSKVISLKIPTGLNERLHRYIGEHWMERPEKQALLKRALMLLCYELETGEQLIDFEDGDA